MTVSTYAPELDNMILLLMAHEGNPVDSVIVIDRFALDPDHFFGDGPAVRRAFGRLAKQGLIRRAQNPERPQRATYEITEAGRIVSTGLPEKHYFQLNFGRENQQCSQIKKSTEK